MGRRDEALDTALTVLAEQGARGLTHTAVDRRGGLPPGTTSNHFRTRDALLAGVLDHLATTEMATAATIAAAAPDRPTVESLAGEVAAMVGHLLGPGREQTLARYAIFLEAAWRPELREPLLTSTARFWAVLERRLTALGAPDPAAGARTLLACIDGVLVDQLIRPQEGFDPGAALGPVVAGLARRT